MDRASLSSARLPLVATIRAARLDEDIAPAELVAMLVLLRFGPGAYSLANELNRRRLRA